MILTCSTCLHALTLRKNSKTSHKSCIYCLYKNRNCGRKDCVHCYSLSIASSIHDSRWSPRNERPSWTESVFSKEKAWFICKCGHETLGVTRSMLKNINCRYCVKDLCGNIECQQCFARSLSNSVLVHNYSKKNSLKSHQVPQQSNLLYWWKCQDCHHEFQNFIYDHQKFACNYCRGSKLCKDQACQWCLRKSFLSNTNSEYWSQNNKLSARQVTKNSHQLALFVCQTCNKEFQKTIQVVNHAQLVNCGCIRHHTAGFVKDLSIQNFCKVVPEYSLKNLAPNYPTWRYDYFLPTESLFIELDGDHHFRSVKEWKSCPIKNTLKDVIKMQLALKNGFRIIRLYQPEIQRKQLGWIEAVVAFLNGNQSYQFVVSENKKMIYQNHKTLMINKTQDNICQLEAL